MEVIEAFMIAAITGVLSSVTTVAALKTDITWIKGALDKLETRVRDLEGAKT